MPAMVAAVVWCAVLLAFAPTSSSLSSQSPFASLSPIAFGTLNPAYANNAGQANILATLPKRTLIDTAEKYGTNDGDAESALRLAAQTSNRRLDGEEIFVATKFAPKPWRRDANSVVAACRASAERLGVDGMDLYQLHFSDRISQPFKLLGYTDNKDEVYWEGLARCVELGLAKHVGVCNYGPSDVRAAHEALAKRGVKLASNQINFNLMRHRSSMETKAVCDELGIQVMAYHPLGWGVLTGKYDEAYLQKVTGGLNPENSKKMRVKWYQRNCGPIIDAVGEVARRRGKTAAQVAVNWCICKGTMPICGAREVDQALDVLGADWVGEEEDGERWRLTPEEVAELDEASFASAEFAKGFELV